MDNNVIMKNNNLTIEDALGNLNNMIPTNYAEASNYQNLVDDLTKYYTFSDNPNDKNILSKINNYWGAHTKEYEKYKSEKNRSLSLQKMKNLIPSLPVTSNRTTNIFSNLPSILPKRSVSSNLPRNIHYKCEGTVTQTAGKKTKRKRNIKNNKSNKKKHGKKHVNH